MHTPWDHFIITLSLATDVTDVILGASDLWLGTRSGAGGTATIANFYFILFYFCRSSMDNRSFHVKLINAFLLSQIQTISTIYLNLLYLTTSNSWISH